MDHRKFKKRVNELVDELTAAQAQKLVEALRQRGDGDEVQKLLEQKLIDELKCPHCGGVHIHLHGVARGLQRYKCLDCERTFNALTGTPLARLRHRSRWLAFAEQLKLSHSVREAAKQTKIDKSTSFRWRHRFLEAEKQPECRALSGIVEADETFILESFKGQRNLPRPSRKRGGKAASPGLSAEQIPILIARDRHGEHVDAVLPDRSEASVRSVLSGVLSKGDVLLCTDGDPALIAFAKRQGIEYELIIASRGEHVHEKVLHIQNVNSYMSRFKAWLRPFNGVATKYLQNYLGWRRMLEKSGGKLSPESCLAAAIG